MFSARINGFQIITFTNKSLIETNSKNFKFNHVILNYAYILS